MSLRRAYSSIALLNCFSSDNLVDVLPITSDMFSVVANHIKHVIKCSQSNQTRDLLSQLEGRFAAPGSSRSSKFSRASHDMRVLELLCPRLLLFLPLRCMDYLLFSLLDRSDNFVKLGLFYPKFKANLPHLPGKL